MLISTKPLSCWTLALNRREELVFDELMLSKINGLTQSRQAISYTVMAVNV